jgi:hypothetical protein
LARVTAVDTLAAPPFSGNAFQHLPTAKPE